MAPKFLINKYQKTVWEYTPDLATNTDLEPYYGDDETTDETALADGEVVQDAMDDDDVVVDPDTGELVVADKTPVVKRSLKKVA